VCTSGHLTAPANWAHVTHLQLSENLYQKWELNLVDYTVAQAGEALATKAHRRRQLLPGVTKQVVHQPSPANARCVLPYQISITVIQVHRPTQPLRAAPRTPSR
jgi:hypothetical protein